MRARSAVPPCHGTVVGSRPDPVSLSAILFLRADFLVSLFGQFRDWSLFLCFFFFLFSAASGSAPSFKVKMFFDLNVPYSPDDSDTPHTLNFLAERKSFLPAPAQDRGVLGHMRF